MSEEVSGAELRLWMAELRLWVEAKLESVNAHFVRIDEATKLLDRGARQVPTELQTAISNTVRVFSEQFDSMNRAIDKQDEVNKEVVRGLEKSVDDLKDRLGRAEAKRSGYSEMLGWMVAVVSIAVAVVAVIVR